MAEITEIRSMRGSKRRRVFLDGEEWRAVPADVVRGLGLQAGQELEEADLEGSVLALERTSAWDRALRLLDFKERGTEELRRRLTDDGYGSEVVDDVLARVVELGFVSDERFAEMLARSLAEGRLLGSARVAAGMSAKGVHEDLRAEMLGRFCAPEAERARAGALAARLVKPCAGDPRKLAARLSAKGYPSRIAWDVALAACGEGAAEEDPAG